MDMQIEGLRVLVTAGAGGIGLEVARAFVREGAKVFVCDVDRAALRCPEDLSLALLGAPTGTRGTAPGGGADFGGFVVPMRAMGRDAVRLLLRLIEGDRSEPTRRLLPCEPVEGGTLAPVPSPTHHPRKD